MTDQTKPWWADRSRRVRLEITGIALAIVVVMSFLAGTNFGGGNSPTGEPTGVAEASPPGFGQGTSPVQGPTAPSIYPASSPSPSPAASPTSPQGTPRSNPTAKPTPRPTSNPTPRPTPRPTATPVSTPTGLSGDQTGKHVDLTWQASAGAVAYDVYRGEGGGITLLAKGLTKTGYRDLTVTAGVTYSYQVSAIGSNGSQSPRSRIFTIKVV